MNLIINNGTNDYTGGTEIKGYQTRAAVAHALATGPVQVDAGSTLVAAVSDVMSSAADLYLDYDSSAGTCGKLNLASGTTTTTSNAFIGGTGGWANPVGYTQLAPGTYTSTELPDYITGTGSLVVPDTIAPAAVSDLAAGDPAEDSLTLTWTAPGDDGSTGTASTYDIRYSTSSITESNWDAATQVTGEPAPAAAGTSQSMTVSGLSASTTYYFAIKTADEVPNLSAISNIADGTTTSGSYTWVGPTDGDWLTASNWSGSPAFANEADDICDINSGGTAKITTSGASFLGQPNLNSGAVLNQGGLLGTSTIGSLHLNGGTVNMGGGSSISVTAGITMDADSTLTALGSSNNTLSAVFTGSGDLTITNNQPSGKQLGLNTGDSSSYSGSWTLGGTGYYSITGDLGTATIHANATITGVGYSCTNGAVNWILGGTTLSFGSQTNVQNGQITVLADSTIKSVTDYYRKTTTINGKITGTGKVTLNSWMSRGYDLGLILNNSTNDYSGGSEVTGYSTEAAVANSLGTGNVEVDPGATLIVAVSDVMNDAADLYLDYNSTYGILDLADGTTTTVAHAYIGGTGGWANPVGYTELAAGTYTSVNLPDYITGTGSLAVTP